MKNSVWVVTVNMGYGHQRAADALSHLAGTGGVMYANNYPEIPETDKGVWEQTRRLYELISRFKKFPVLGDFVFSLFDQLQDLAPFYPKERPIESPTLQLRQIYGLLERKQWGQHFITELNKDPKPLVCTFFVPAFMAEHWRYKGPIFLVVTDSDISRAWVPFYPKQSVIHYLVPTERAEKRLQRYGIAKERITLTGFPLPQDMVEKAPEDVKRRVARLDPNLQYISRYEATVQKHLGGLPQKETGPVVITFAIGGAGAQQELGKDIMEGLLPLLKQKKVELNLVVGVHVHLVEYYKKAAKELGVSSLIGKGIHIHSSSTTRQYFESFPFLMRQTDILWTKPSELSFYAALGIPLILAPSVGAHEVENKTWILQRGAGFEQLKPKHASQWIADLMEGGLLAEAAMDGFIEMEREGTANITKLIESLV